MTRLIDADALDREMYRKSFEVDDGRNVWNSGLWIRYKIYEEAIRDAPTVEAVPVRHGKWIKLDMHAHLADHRCTACGQECYVPTCMGEPMYIYCPNCGARMDEE